MALPLKIFPGGAAIEFGTGSFDAWCVFLSLPGKKRYAPTDLEYFGDLLHLAGEYGPVKIYNDFLIIYRQTTHEINTALLAQISVLAGTYENHKVEVDILFTLIYAGMIAEENKAGAILKKRIKRLAMHQIFKEGMPVEEAAIFSRGKNWKDLDKLMKEKGF
ncbi:MAG: hypothetical protein ABIT96_12925 [Ferruginibacter sp.]